MLIGSGRHRLQGKLFSAKPNLGPRDSSGGRGMVTGYSGKKRETANLGVPDGTTLRSFAKPTNVGLDAGLISRDPHVLLNLAREMYDNDSLLGAAVNIFSEMPFGNFSLGDMPDKNLLRPYEISLDRVRSKTLMPVLSVSHLVDGAFLGGGMFDENKKVWDAIIPYDMMHATIIPVPFFGATPIVDVQIHQDALKMMRLNDSRMERYTKYMPRDLLQGGLIKLEPENTFYIPRKARADQPLGVSLFRNVMIIYLLEKALARGTLELAYRRQRAMLHIQTGDENWEASVEEMQYISDLFMAADLDPLGAVVVTRPGVNPQEVGGAGDFWKWTDNMDILNAVKLRGIGFPDGLFGGDMPLDSVSATLTTFINKMRSFRDYITRIFFYEKFFPYISITNGHEKNQFQTFESGRYQTRANDSEVDMENFLTPTVSWHNSLRPEGDKDYVDLLETLRQAGVPVPLRMMAAAGGLDIHDIMNNAPDDLELRKKVAEYNAQANQLDADSQPQLPPGAEDDGSGGGDGGTGGGFDEESKVKEALLNGALGVVGRKRKGLLDREYDDRMQARSPSNNHRHYTTARESRDIEQKRDRMISSAMSNLARRLNQAQVRNHKVSRKAKGKSI